MTLDPGYFRDRYAASADPWGLAERWYENRKYALSVAMLPREQYGTAFEPGCSIGVLTVHLARRCDSLLACDAMPEAVASARARRGGRDDRRPERRHGASRRRAGRAPHGLSSYLTELEEEEAGAASA